jgi:hypothetical protein
MGLKANVENTSITIGNDDSQNNNLKSLTAELKKWTDQIYVMTVRSQNAAVYEKFKYEHKLGALNAKRYSVAEKIQQQQENISLSIGRQLETA